MAIRVLYFIGGLCAVGLGYKVYTEGGWWSWKNQMYIGYNGIQEPIGILFFIMGLISIYSSIRFSRRTPVEHICSECENVETLQPKKKHLCLKCGAIMEELNGFYNRHPEKR